jgi:SNF2 family DNA or RNA helicase
MLRRRKQDVLDLPPKIYTTEYVEMGEEQESIYQEVRTQIIQNIDKIMLSKNPLTELIRLRQATGFTGILSEHIRVSSKFDRALDILEDVVANNGKAVIFSQWTTVIDPLYEFLKKSGYNPAIITGDIKDREAEQNKFKDDKTCKVLVGTIASMGTGLTLTSANTVIFLDSPWNKATKEQAEDRCHRIGTVGTVNVITLVCKNTIDESIEEVVYLKGKLSDAIVDGEIKTTDRKGLLKALLSL